MVVVLIKFFSHMSCLMGHNKSRGEAILVVQSAASHRVTHSCHRSITCKEREDTSESRKVYK